MPFLGGLVLAALGFGAYLLFVDIRSGDDDPIVVAGGSLRIGARKGFEQNAKSTRQADHKHKKRVLEHIQVLYNPGPMGGPALADLVFGKAVTVVIDYCNPNNVDCLTSPDDVVTFATDASGQNLNVISSTGLGPGAEIDGNGQITHLPANFLIKQFVITGVTATDTPSLCERSICTFPCSDGKCSATLFYHCNLSGADACKN